MRSVLPFSFPCPSAGSAFAFNDIITADNRPDHNDSDKKGSSNGNADQD